MGARLLLFILINSLSSLFCRPGRYFTGLTASFVPFPTNLRVIDFSSDRLRDHTKWELQQDDVDRAPLSCWTQEGLHVVSVCCCSCHSGACLRLDDEICCFCCCPNHFSAFSGAVSAMLICYSFLFLLSDHIAGQNVQVELSFNFFIDRDRLYSIYYKYETMDRFQSALANIAIAEIKAVTTQFTTTDFFTSRRQISALMQSQLRNRLSMAMWMPVIMGWWW
jgi:hypothetical protein